MTNLNERLDKQLNSINEVSDEGWYISSNADVDEVVGEKIVAKGIKLEILFIHTRGIQLEDIERKPLWNFNLYVNKWANPVENLGKYYLKDLTREFGVPSSFLNKLKSKAEDVVNHYN